MNLSTCVHILRWTLSAYSNGYQSSPIFLHVESLQFIAILSNLFFFSWHHSLELNSYKMAQAGLLWLMMVKLIYLLMMWLEPFFIHETLTIVCICVHELQVKDSIHRLEPLYIVCSWSLIFAFIPVLMFLFAVSVLYLVSRLCGLTKWTVSDFSLLYSGATYTAC